MRRGVSKPLAESRPRLKAQGRTDELLQRPTLDIGTKLSASSIDNRRLKHARVVPKSRLISRYNLDSITAVSTSTQRQVVHRQPTPVVSRSHRPASGRVTTTADLLQHAIEQANSHRQAPPKTRPVSTRHHTRIVSVSTLALAAILLFGFVLHQDMPNIKLDLASSRAGFAASLPADQPAGFSLNGLSAVTGQVALHFRSNSDTSRNYTITEKPSQWNSATLRDMFVIEASNDSYQAVQVAGRTAYIYGQQDITWVSGGIWYEIHSNGALSNQQLTDIAASV